MRLKGECVKESSILIIEDESAIADVLTYALVSEGYAVRHSTLGYEGLELLRSGNYALVIMDIGLPDMNGFDVCRKARNFTDIPILFLSSRSDEVDRVVGLEIGADDYVTKPFSPREVVARVRVILRRGMPSKGVKSTQWFSIDFESARIHYCGSLLDLTRYEYLLLKVLLKHPGRIYSRDQLMDLVWCDALETSDRTVDTHIKTLRAKLKTVRNGLEPIVTHRGMGYSVTNGKEA